jgi:hypothetical protein
VHLAVAVREGSIISLDSIDIHDPIRNGTAPTISNVDRLIRIEDTNKALCVSLAVKYSVEQLETLSRSLKLHCRVVVFVAIGTSRQEC